LPSPDGSKYPFVPGFGTKDIVDSGSEAVMKTYRSAPKKKHQPFDQCFYKIWKSLIMR
jgi:hypothetical protein